MMHSILVVNPKGGSGKTTIATNLAGYFAAQGKRVVLADMDRQQSTATWLARRPEKLPHIKAWTAATDKKEIHAFDAHWSVVDSPVGVHGEKLTSLMRRVELVVVPVAPSAFAMEATKVFLAELLAEKPVKNGERQVVVID